MKVNWKVRFHNGVWLASFLSMVVSFVYEILRMFDVVPFITESQVADIISKVLMILGMLGVITDPTTAGIGDSQRAMTYEYPWVDPVETEPFSELPPETNEEDDG